MNTHMKLGLQMMRRTSAFLMEDGNVRTNVGSIARQVIALNAVVDRLSALDAEREAGAEVGREFSRGQHILRVLHAMVAPQLRGTGGLERWTMLCRFPRKARQRRRRRAFAAGEQYAVSYTGRQGQQ